MAKGYAERRVSARQTRLRREFVAEWMVLLDAACRLEAAFDRLPDGVFTKNERITISISIDQIWSLLINERPKVALDEAGELMLVPGDGVHPITAAVMKRLGVKL